MCWAVQLQEIFKNHFQALESVLITKTGYEMPASCALEFDAGEKFYHSAHFYPR